MDITTVKAHIKTRKFDNLYLFTGDEVGVMDIYIRQIASKFGGVIKRPDSVYDIVTISNKKSMLPERSVCVFRDCKEFIQDDKLQAVTELSGESQEHIFIFIYTSIDKRTKFYKKYQDRIVEFEHLKKDILTKYIQREIRLSDKSCEKLAEICESDYSRILLEINKIQHYIEARFNELDGTRFEDDAFEKLVKDGTIYTPPYDAVFDFVDAVLQNKPKLAFNLLEQSYDSGEATLVLLSNLYMGAKGVLQVQSYHGSMKLTDATGLTPFQVKLASGRKDVYYDGDLVYLMRLIQEVEMGIKTGAIEESMAVYYVLVNFWSSEV